MPMDATKILEELIKVKSAETSLLDIHAKVTNPDVQYLLAVVEKSMADEEVSQFVSTSIEALIDISWEECNVGHWSEVPETPKILYAYANLQKVFLNLKKAVSRPEQKDKLLRDAINAADLGIMLGKGYENQLTRAASLITSHLGYDVSSQSQEYQNSLQTEIQDRTSDEFLLEKLNVTQLMRSHCPSVEEFGVKYFYTRIPVQLTGCIDHWPALKKWPDLDYLVRIAGPRTVPVEVGSSYTHRDWGMELTSLQDFIAKHIRGRAPKVGYLAQHQLFDQIPELKRDIITPDYCCLSEDEESDCEVNVNAWFGPANTLTPLHYDPKHNLLCQVVGAKRVILFSPEDSKYLHPHDESMLNNTAKVDPYNPDYDTFPDFKKATAYFCKLKPGEALYIPPKWWHHVVSVDVSFSVSFWWE